MLDEAAIARIAKLARIAVTAEEKTHFAQEVSGILTWIEQLNAVNTSNVAPVSSVTDVTLPWREDCIIDGNQADAVLANAPASDYGCFAVPKVME